MIYDFSENTLASQTSSVDTSCSSSGEAETSRPGLPFFPIYPYCRGRVADKRPIPPMIEDCHFLRLSELRMFCFHWQQYSQFPKTFPQVFQVERRPASAAIEIMVWDQAIGTKLLHVRELINYIMACSTLEIQVIFMMVVSIRHQKAFSFSTPLSS